MNVAADLPGRVKVLWFLPTHGDGRYLGTAIGGRATDLGYLRQIAVAADRLGYYGVLLPTGKSCEDSWIVASAMVPLTEQLRFLVAVKPGLQPPTVAARMTSTLDRLSNGRASSSTWSPAATRSRTRATASSSATPSATRSPVNSSAPKALLAGETVNTEGKHIHIEGGQLLFPPVQQPSPPLYFGGSSDEAIDVAAETVDKYLTWGEPPALVADKVAKVKAAARKRGRTVTFGIRLHEAVAAFARVTGAAYDAYLKDPAAWLADKANIDKVVNLSGAKPEDVPLVLAGYTFPTLAEQVSPELLGGGTIKAIIATAEFLKEQGNVPEVLADYAPYVNPAYASRRRRPTDVTPRAGPIHLHRVGSSSEGGDPMSPFPELEARDLSVEYETGETALPALVSIDLAVEPGEFLAVLGPSGSGKTTLLNAFAGFVRPTAGAVFFRGEPIRLSSIFRRASCRYAAFSARSSRRRRRNSPRDATGARRSTASGL